jgi:hypothetical protein
MSDRTEPEPNTINVAEEISALGSMLAELFLHTMTRVELEPRSLAILAWSEAMSFCVRLRMR